MVPIRYTKRNYFYLVWKWETVMKHPILYNTKWTDRQILNYKLLWLVSSLLCRADERAKYTSGLNQMISPYPPLNSQASPFSVYFTAQPSEILLLPPRTNCLTRRAGMLSQLSWYSDHAKCSTTMASWFGIPAWKHAFLLSRTLRRALGLIHPI